MKYWLPLTCTLTGCLADSVQTNEADVVRQQQAAYLIAQPVPLFDYSLERDRAVQLYAARQKSVLSWSVWRSATGVIEDWCPSSGAPLPYGVQLTAPEARERTSNIVLPQAEPNGLYTNGITTQGTWVFCVRDGAIEPTYVEDNVTAYFHPITVDWANNRVVHDDGAASVTLTK